MEKAKEAGVNEDHEFVVGCENQIVEATETSICNSLVSIQKSQPNVIIECNKLSKEEGKDCMLSEMELSHSQASEVLSDAVGEALLSHRNEDIVLEQENMLDNLGREAGSSCIETSEDEPAKTCTLPTPEENVPVAHSQVAEAEPSEETTDKESSCLEGMITESLSELSVSGKVVRAEPMEKDQPGPDISVGIADAVLFENTATIEKVAENTSHLHPEVNKEDLILKRINLLKKQVDRSFNLCSKSLVDDYLSVKKFFEEIDQQEILLQEMSSQAELLKSILESAEGLPEEVKCNVLDHLEACFNGGHWLDKTVKTKQLAECRQLLNKSYVLLRYSGISKVKSIIDQHLKSTSKLPIQGLPRADMQEAACDPFLVTVTHVIDPGEFYVVRLCDKAKLDRVLSELRDNAYSYPIPLEITPGIVYAVCNSGLNWFRGSCGKECGRQQVGDQPAEILYEFFMIDQGHHERIPASSIRILPRDLLSSPNFARECTLNHNFQGAPWGIQATTLFKQMTRQSPMNMKIFSQHGGVLEVDLAQLISFGEAANIVSVRDALFFSHRPSSTEPAKKKFKPKYAVEELENFKHFSVIVSAAETPSNIYVRVLDEEFTTYLPMKQELQAEMADASTPSSFSHIQKGFICTVKYHELWYRCLVEDIYQHNRLLVFYVDSGHRQVVNCSECFNLPERFFDLPAQAIRCSLDGVTNVNPRAPAVNKSRRNQNMWSREAIEMVRGYRDTRGVVIVENWKKGEIGRLDRELSAYVVLYKDGERSSLNNNLVCNNLVFGNKKLMRPEHAVIRSNLVAQRRISQSTSINSVGSGLCAPSTDASVLALTPLDKSNFSLPPNYLTSDPNSNNSVLVENDKVSTELNNGHRDFANDKHECIKTACDPFDFGISSDDQSFVGKLLVSCNINELPTSVSLAPDAQESIACDVFSSTQRQDSSFKDNAFFVNVPANNAIVNFEAPDYIPNPWDNYDFKFEKVLTGESTKSGLSQKTLMNRIPPEDVPSTSNNFNRGDGHFPQDTLTDLTSRMSLQSTAVQSDFLTTVSNLRPKREVVNNTEGSSDCTSFIKPNTDSDIVGTQGTQPDSETSIKVSFVWIDSPEAIFFRTAEMQSQFEDLRYQMKQHYGKYRQKHPKWNFDVGARCAVEDNRSWWRAEVVCMDNLPVCNVSFVDTGYQRAVKAKHIYPLEPEFDEIKRLMLMCSLFGVYPGTSDEKWNGEAVNYIRDRLMGSEEIHILKRGPESKCSALPIMCLYTYDVEGGPLQIPGLTRINLNEELVAMDLAHHCSEPFIPPKLVSKIQKWKSSEPPKRDSVFWGVVTWINLTGEIYLHDVKSAPSLVEITKWLNDAYNGTEPSHADLNCSPGDLCIARYTGDQSWYRAIVKRADEPGNVTVFFVDYGTLDSVDCRDIRLNIMLEELPTLAICCKLYNIRPSGGNSEWPVETLNLIHREIVEQEFRVNVKVRGLPLQVVLVDKKCMSYSDLLVKRNLAELIDPSLKKKSKKKRNGKK